MIMILRIWLIVVATAFVPLPPAWAGNAKSLLLLGQGPDGHPPQTHEYRAGLKILSTLLAKTPGLDVTIVDADEPWKDGPEVLAKADGAVLFLAEGAKWLNKDPRRLAAFNKLAERMGGLVALHWAMGTRDAKNVEPFVRLFGGCHGGPDRKYKVLTTQAKIADAKHPIARGLTPFEARDEFYYTLKFPKPMDAVQPILRVAIDGEDHTVAWAYERPDGGRSFGFSGLHFHDNWRLPEYRRLVVHGVLWAMHLPIPDKGASVRIGDADLLAFEAAATEKTFGTIVRKDPRFDKLIPKDAKLVKLATGFKWTEGPAWDKERRLLYFSDIPNNRVNIWKEGEGIGVLLHQAGYTGKTRRGGEPGSNGLVFDKDGHLVLCEHGDRRVTRYDLKTFKKTVLADNYMGKRFNSPNDLVFHSNGDLYFTDPPYGLEKNWDDPARELDFCGVYRLSRDGKITLLTKDMSRPNGIALSPDEKTLYVANSDPKQPIWMAFAVKADGTLGEGRVFFDAGSYVKAKKPGLPDGLKVDVHGNLFATGPGGVHVFAPDGTLLGTLDTGVPTANCAFGADGSVLYIAANDSIARIRTTTKGKGF